MKKTATLLVLGIIISILTAGVSPKTSKAPVKTNADVYEYQWFYDADYTDPTGTYSDVTTEINRLKRIFPAYTFTDTWSVGLHQFDWGYRPYENGAAIYSDLQ